MKTFVDTYVPLQMTRTFEEGRFLYWSARLGNCIDPLTGKQQRAKVVTQTIPLNVEGTKAMELVEYHDLNSDNCSPFVTTEEWTKDLTNLIHFCCKQLDINTISIHPLMEKLLGLSPDYKAFHSHPSVERTTFGCLVHEQTSYAVVLTRSDLGTNEIFLDHEHLICVRDFQEFLDDMALIEKMDNYTDEVTPICAFTEEDFKPRPGVLTLGANKVDIKFKVEDEVIDSSKDVDWFEKNVTAALKLPSSEPLAMRFWSRAPGRFVNKITGCEAIANRPLATGPMFYGTVLDWYETLVESVCDAGNEIHKQTVRYSGNTVKLNPEGATILQYSRSYQPRLDSGDSKHIGTLCNRFAVYVDNSLPSNIIEVSYSESVPFSDDLITLERVNIRVLDMHVI